MEPRYNNLPVISPGLKTSPHPVLYEIHPLTKLINYTYEIFHYMSKPTPEKRHEPPVLFFLFHVSLQLNQHLLFPATVKVLLQLLECWHHYFTYGLLPGTVSNTKASV